METNCVGPAGEKSKDSPVHTPVSSLDCQCWNCMSMWSAERFLCPDTTVPSPFRPVHKSRMKSVMNEEDWTNTLIPSSHPPSSTMLSACWPLSHWHNYMHTAKKNRRQISFIVKLCLRRSQSGLPAVRSSVPYRGITVENSDSASLWQGIKIHKLAINIYLLNC